VFLMLSVAINLIIPSVIMLSVVMLVVVAPLLDRSASGMLKP
jgi:hypothetical protein